MTNIPFAKTFGLPFEWLSSTLLDNPLLFNYFRNLLAGDQNKTKSFVRDALLKYNCKTVLDFGCGTGDFSESCTRDMEYLGTDLNAKYIKFAKSHYIKHKNKKFIEDNILKYKNLKKYDAVLFISMMHHFSDNELDIILKDIKKMVKKVLIIADIIPDPPNAIQKIAARLDRGKFVRPKKDKLNILKKYFKVTNAKIINSRIAVQYGVLCETIKNN